MNDQLPDASASAEGQAPPAAPEGDAELAPRPVKRFEEFGLHPQVLEALRSMGIHTPTPIQELVIPRILAGKDVIGKAETGTGKTIGFGAPIAGRVDTERVATQALVLTPTRELALQVAGVLEELGVGRQLGVALLVGGVHASEQVLKLRSRSQVVVGTPGRVLDLLGDRTLSLVWCETVVLDEADRMLDMGFIDEVGKIIEKIPSERQTLLFSATIPPEIQRLARRYMRDPETYSTSRGIATVPEIRQRYLLVEFRDKFPALCKIVDEHPQDTFIIFCNTRRQAIDLDRMMWGHGYPAGALHGEQEQEVRFRILEAFRRRDIRILVATDVASRGLDIDDVGWIVNFEVPDEAESYVHRIGRTGRAQKTGNALTLVAKKELSDWLRISRVTGFVMEPMGDVISERHREESGRRDREGRRGGRRPGRGGERRGGRGPRGQGGERSRGRGEGRPAERREHRPEGRREGSPGEGRRRPEDRPGGSGPPRAHAREGGSGEGDPGRRRRRRRGRGGRARGGGGSSGGGGAARG